LAGASNSAPGLQREVWGKDCNLVKYDFVKKLFFVSPENQIPLNKISDFTIELVYIGDWRNKTLPDLVSKVYNKISSQKNIYLGGFSMGGLIALIVSEHINLKGLSLYSPSPHLSETDKIIKTVQKYYATKKDRKRAIDKIMKSAENYSIKDIIKNINIKNVPVDIYVGSKELKFMIDNAKELNTSIKKSSLIIAKEYSHTNICSYY